MFALKHVVFLLSHLVLQTRLVHEFEWEPCVSFSHKDRLLYVAQQKDESSSSGTWWSVQPFS